MTAAADTRSTYGDLARFYLPVAIAVVVVVFALLLFVAVRYRARDGREPWKGMTATKLEIGYVLALAVVAGVLVWRTYDAIGDVDPVVPARAASASAPATLTIGVVASQWNWRFSYPDGVVQTGNGRERLPVLVVPAGQPVRFRLASADVVHAFWIPALRAKYDALPDRVNVFDLEFRPGLDYATARCSEFCGAYHEQMRFRVDVRSPAAFAAWLRGRRA